MLKRSIALLLMIVVVFGLLVACQEKTEYLTEAEATEIALKAMGITKAQASSIHVHVGTHSDQPCYNVYITQGSTSKTYVISTITGQILAVTDGGGHSH